MAAAAVLWTERIRCGADLASRTLLGRLADALTSSVRVRTGSPLCGPAFLQLDPDRQGQS
jgi:hypothetical protein